MLDMAQNSTTASLDDYAKVNEYLKVIDQRILAMIKEGRSCSTAIREANSVCRYESLTSPKRG